MDINRALRSSPQLARHRYYRSRSSSASRRRRTCFSGRGSLTDTTGWRPLLVRRHLAFHLVNALLGSHQIDFTRRSGLIARAAVRADLVVPAVLAAPGPPESRAAANCRCLPAIGPNSSTTSVMSSKERRAVMAKPLPLLDRDSPCALVEPYARRRAHQNDREDNRDPREDKK